MRDQARITAVLGPTNTGKTHFAIDRMLGYRTGVIGLPLRLLAREVYDRCVAARGPSVVALVTGEERIVPDRAQYWVCTVEAMPLEIGADFVAVDEIQLCADLDRGHVFTDRLLHARGLQETMLMGSDIMRGAIAALEPRASFVRRERFSELSYKGSKKISRMPERSAIVGFSVENVYAIAELIRRTKGGCAVVMGALSPRTRNAQVELYQNGDVDYLVATDAIGMGLNLDIRHVAFSALSKFDGRRMRPLHAQELAQIAGRAGRHLNPGSFGVTGEARELDDEVVEAIENHRFPAVTKLQWRNAALEFGSVDRLIGSLERFTSHDWLTRVRESDDLAALKNLAAMPEVRDAATTGPAVRLLWDVCRIPDFRSISPAEHAGLLQRIFGFLIGGGRVPDDWLARNIARIDRPDGDIDAISKRLAYIRTWTYVAQRQAWVQDEAHWREATRAVEDRLSDALHARLTQRFVDRRTSVLMRRLKQKETLVAEVNDKGEVTVEGEFIGRLDGFRFRQDASASPDEARTLRQASVQALRPEFHLRADRFYNAPDTEIDFTEQGGLLWGTQAVGKLIAGSEALRPQVEAFVDEEAGQEVAEKVRRRLQHFIDRKVAALFDPLLTISRDETLTGLARGFAFRMVESLGILPRDSVAEEVKALDQDARGALRKHGLRFGQFTIFLPLLLKPAATRLRLVLWSLAQGLQEFPESPPPGLVTIPYLPAVPKSHYTLAGYHPAGVRAIRIDMLERLADLLRARDSRAGFEATPEMLSITGMTLEQFSLLMQGLGYRGERGERPKAKAEPARATATPAPEPVVVAEGSDTAPPEPVQDAVSDGSGAMPQQDGAGSGTPVLQTDTPPDPAVASPGPTDSPAEMRADSALASRADDPLRADGVSVPPTGADPVAEVKSAGADPVGPDPAEVQPVEREVFYTFTWAPRPRRDMQPREGQPREAQAVRHDRSARTRPPRTDAGPAAPAASEAAATDQQRPRRDGRHASRDDARRTAGPASEGAARDGAARDGTSHAPGPTGTEMSSAGSPADRTTDALRPTDGSAGQRKDGERTDGGRKDGNRGDGGGKNRSKGAGRNADSGKPSFERDRFDKPQGQRPDAPRSFEARPARTDKIDPDNPFAVLLTLKDRK